MSASDQSVVKPLVPMSLGEMFGPQPCERPGCLGNAWMIWMTREELEKAKGQEEMHPIAYVFKKRIGSALCDECSLESV